MPFFSIIIPTYNAEAYITETLNSIYSQSFEDYEIILIDDESTDNSVACAREVQNDKRLKIFSIPHAGKPSVARNYGIERATGECIFFLDADDLLAEDCLLKRHSNHTKHPSTVLIFGDYHCFVDQNRERVFDDQSYFQKNNNYIQSLSERYFEFRTNSFCLFAPTLFSLLLIKLIIHTSTVSVQSDVVKTISGFNEDKLYGEDWDLWLRIAKKYTIGVMDEVVCYKRRSSSSLTASRIRYLKSIIDFQSSFINQYNPDRETINGIKQTLHSLMLEVAHAHYFAGECSDAKYYFKLAAKNGRMSNIEHLRYIFCFIPEKIMNILRSVKRKILSHT